MSNQYRSFLVKSNKSDILEDKEITYVCRCSESLTDGTTQYHAYYHFKSMRTDRILRKFYPNGIITVPDSNKDTIEFIMHHNDAIEKGKRTKGKRTKIQKQETSPSAVAVDVVKPKPRKFDDTIVDWFYDDVSFPGIDVIDNNVVIKDCIEESIPWCIKCPYHEIWHSNDKLPDYEVIDKMLEDNVLILHINCLDKKFGVYIHINDKNMMDRYTQEKL